MGEMTNMKLDILRKPAETVAGKLAPLTIKLSKHSPEIFLGVGAASVIGGVVLACKTTWDKLPDRINEKDDELIEAIVPTSAEKTAAYSRMALKIARDYAPSALLVVGGIGLMAGGHRQLRTRLAAVGAAYATLDEAYSSYRARVIEDYGADVDRKFRLGIRDEEVVVGKRKTKNGKEKDVVEVHEAVHADGSGYSLYARYFDQFNSDEHTADQEYNWDFLRIKQGICNERFQRQGYLFLNDVYRELGFKEVPEGQLVGWMKGMGDDYVDFGLMEARNASARDYVNNNGKESCFVLDFNVDGLMWDLI